MYTLRSYASAALVASLALISTATFANDYYVSPVGKGTRCDKSLPCDLQTAQRVVRAAAANQRADIHVNLMDGTYTLTQPLSLVEKGTTSDSGKNGFKIVWQGADKARPVLSGGISVGGWILHEPSKNIWRADAPAGLNPRQLYVNGRRADRTITSDLMAGYTVTDRGFRLKDAVFSKPIDISKFRNLRDVELLRLFNWQLSRCSVLGATATDIEVHPICLFNSKSANLGIFIENAYELLNQPGQWYFDRSGAISVGGPSVYYIPRDRETMQVAKAILGVTEKLVTLEGTQDRPIHDITFKGVTFSHGTWFIDQALAGKVGGYQGLQAGVHLLNEADFLLTDRSDNPGKIPQPPTVVGGFYDPINLAYEDYLPGIVTVNYANRVSFMDNSFSHIGATALAMVRGIQNSAITGNEFFDISGSAIQLGGVDREDHHPCGDVPTCDNGRVTQNNVISNNRVSDVSAEFFDAVAIFIGYTRNTVVSNNELSNLPYSGISMGWGWGWIDKGGILGWKNPTIVSNNRISSNNINRFLTRQRDGAAIYTLGGQPGSVINGNFANDGKHDFAAIYQDEGSSGFTVENNVTTKVRNAILINCNKNDVTQGNTYRTTYSDTGAVMNSCFRGKNDIEIPVRFADRHASEDEWPVEVKAIVGKAGLEPEYKKRAQGKITSVDFDKPE